MGTDVSGGHHTGSQRSEGVSINSVALISHREILMVVLSKLQHGIVEVSVEGSAELKTIKVVGRNILYNQVLKNNRLRLFPPTFFSEISMLIQSSVVLVNHN